MVFCTSCGTKCEAGARFCISCGAPLLASAPAPAPAATKPVATAPTAPAAAATKPTPTPAQVAASVCGGCGRTIGSDDSYAVGALGKRWHKDCFKCSKCNDRLFSFARFYEEAGMPVCAKCNAKSIPRCAACHKPVEGQYVMSLGKAYHADCMRCAGCGQPFGEDGFFEDGGKLWHLQCQH